MPENTSPTSGPLLFKRTISALYPIVCSSDVPPHPAANDILRHVDQTLRSFPVHVRYALVAGTTLFEFGPALVPHYHGRVFSRLSRERQDEWFARLWNSQNLLLHQFLKALKGIIVLAYYEQDVVKKQLRYHPREWIAEVRQRRLAKWDQHIAQEQEKILSPDPLVPSMRLLHKVHHE